MSNVYILEPPTSGKVLLKTTVGDIDVELWAKETPKTCRNFIQLCLEGYYNNTIFHRVVKGFIVQGGDPNGDGTGGESIYGAPFKDEFHQRLKFTRRGLLAMANAGKDDNGSQYFFTLGATPELQDKHTIFGKITGETIFNMLKLEEGLVKEERPVYPHKIIKVEVLHNPFPDIEPRVKEVVVNKKVKKEKKKGVKNFKLLSFGDEAEDDEEESTRVNEKFVGKSKSTHDVLDDPKLSSKTEEKITNQESEEEQEEIAPGERLGGSIKDKLKKKREDPVKPSSSQSSHEASEEEKPDKKKAKFEDSEKEIQEAEIQEAQGEITTRQRLENVRNKLKKKPREPIDPDLDPEDAYASHLNEEKLEQKKRKYDEIQKEIQSVKKDYHKNKLKKQEETAKIEEEEGKDETINEYKNECDKYKMKKDALPKKGAGREQFTLKLLEKFKNKLTALKENSEEAATTQVAIPDEEADWLKHRLRFQETTPVLAKDANKKDDDWFEIYDPRSSLNKRRRGENSEKFSKK